MVGARRFTAAALQEYCAPALDKALTEITAHAVYLNYKEGYPVGAAEVALDYFRRLDLGGLGVEVITGELDKTESN